MKRTVSVIVFAASLTGDVGAATTSSSLRQGVRPDRSTVVDPSSALDRALASARALLHSDSVPTLFSVASTVNETGLAGPSGGFQAGSVDAAPLDYKSMTFPDTHNVKPKRCPTGHARVGCMNDGQKEQQRWYREHVQKMDRVPMTPEVCFDFCNNVSGAQFFGLRGGNDCYCTPFFHDISKGGLGECDAPCEGDDSRTCGGANMEDVYSMHDCANMPEQPCKKTHSGSSSCAIVHKSILPKNASSVFQRSKWPFVFP
jgi:hypothetical protein